MAEKQMRQFVVKSLKPLDAISVENAVYPGTPDINYVNGWIEVKWLRSWPKRAGAIVKLKHEFEKEQILWAERRIAKGGNSWLLLQANRTEWFIWPGDVAGRLLGYATREVLVKTAAGYWPRGLEGQELVKWLRENP